MIITDMVQAPVVLTRTRATLGLPIATAHQTLVVHTIQGLLILVLVSAATNVADAGAGSGSRLTGMAAIRRNRVVPLGV